MYHSQFLTTILIFKFIKCFIIIFLFTLFLGLISCQGLVFIIYQVQVYLISYNFLCLSVLFINLFIDIHTHVELFLL